MNRVMVFIASVFIVSIAHAGDKESACISHNDSAQRCTQLSFCEWRGEHNCHSQFGPESRSIENQNSSTIQLCRVDVIPPTQD